MEINKKKILITGASDGIGAAVAKTIAANGGVPILVARTEEKLKALQRELKQLYNVSAYIYVSDISNHESWFATMKQIEADVLEIDALINNAGYGLFERFDQLESDDIKGMVDLNVLGVMYTTKYFLPLLKKKSVSHIINIASQAGKIQTPKSAVYSATKSAVIAFTNSLRLELNMENVYVTSVNLGPVGTSFFSIADPEGTYIKNVKKYMLDPDRVAEKIVQTLFTSKREINLPNWMQLGSKLYQLCPHLMETLLRPLFYKK